jgi:hypothetical protein
MFVRGKFFIERLARNEDSSLLRTLVNYGRKRFYNNVSSMGEKLGCAANLLDYLGNSKDPDLTVARSRLKQLQHLARP